MTLTLPSWDLPRFIGVIAPHALAFFLSGCEIKDRAGGYLCVMDTNGGVLYLEKVGLVRPEKEERYKYLAQEKCHRLLINPRHATSYHSRDETKDCWGGAVRIPSGAIGFSGLAELDDEAFVLTIAVVAKALPLEAAKAAAFAGNETFRKVIDQETRDPILRRIIAECTPRHVV
jgi:hypothetical protein